MPALRECIRPISYTVQSAGHLVMYSARPQYMKSPVCAHFQDQALRSYKPCLKAVHSPLCVMGNFRHPLPFWLVNNLLLSIGCEAVLWMSCGPGKATAHLMGPDPVDYHGIN